mmetsp:Transcript_27391/g.78702  ORF Transcript_27391/g.78702 Transcript_27391/m.78702 type:complete len:228 (-) Transcript_27391:214-897(-)
MADAGAHAVAVPLGLLLEARLHLLLLRLRLEELHVELVEQRLTAPQDIALKPLDVHLHYIQGLDAQVLQQRVQRPHRHLLAGAPPPSVRGHGGVAGQPRVISGASQDAVTLVTNSGIQGALVVPVFRRHERRAHQRHALTDVRIQAEGRLEGEPVPFHWLDSNDIVASLGKDKCVPAQVRPNVQEGPRGGHAHAGQLAQLARVADLPEAFLLQELGHNVLPPIAHSH